MPPSTSGSLGCASTGVTITPNSAVMSKRSMDLSSLCSPSARLRQRGRARVHRADYLLGNVPDVFHGRDHLAERKLDPETLIPPQLPQHGIWRPDGARFRRRQHAALD